MFLFVFTVYVPVFGFEVCVLCVFGIHENIVFSRKRIENVWAARILH